MFRVVALLAWRNLWRNHRRTTIMLMAISVGVWAMIFMTALTRGMVDQMVVDGNIQPGEMQDCRGGEQIEQAMVDHRGIRA